jgi:glucosamine-6-phosphate deaminase
VFIVPVGPVGQYDLLAQRCNREGISLRDLVLIGMDEYLTEDGAWIAEDDPLSFRGHIRRHLWDRLAPALAPPPERRLFPYPDRLDEVPRLIAAHGGVDVCFAGVGIAGHLAFNEPPEPGETVDAAEFAARPTRVLRLARETRTINAITVWGGAIARIPERAVTVGMREILGARKLRLFLNRPWQRAVIRNLLFGPVTPACPASFVQRHQDAAVILTEDAAHLPRPALA